MKVLNENAIREMVRKAIKNAMRENYEAEYRTKGSLNKKTLEKQASQVDKTSGAAPLNSPEPEQEPDYNPDWDDYSMDNIKDLYNNDEEEFDDSQAGGEYKADPSDPYFYTKEGRRIDADAIGNFHNDFAIVKKDGGVNFVDNDGTILSDDWFDACNDFENGFAVVSKNGKRNYICSNGELLLDTWVDRAGDFVGSEAPVIINGERHTVDMRGNIK